MISEQSVTKKLDQYTHHSERLSDIKGKQINHKTCKQHNQRTDYEKRTELTKTSFCSIDDRANDRVCNSIKNSHDRHNDSH